VIAAPSGAGKTTLVHKLMAANPDLRFSISYTTRTPRKTETDGEDYHFVSPDAFRTMIEAGDFLAVVLTATLASIGTAAVPGVGLVMLAMVLRQVDLPVEGIGLIIGVDRLLDMVRTAVNVTGDATVSCVVASSEGQLDRAVFAGDGEP